MKKSHIIIMITIISILIGVVLYFIVRNNLYRNQLNSFLDITTTIGILCSCIVLYKLLIKN